MPVYQSLLSAPALVQVPVIKAQIGKYTFGVGVREKRTNKFVYPNYIQSLEITKINGQVNTYSLVLSYPMTANTDPNFFEKVFASVSKSRTITFTYGDAASPQFLYRNEEAMITNVRSSFQLDGAVITYTVSAVSRAALGLSGAYTFPATWAKPSEEILRILCDPQYGLQDLFTGMRNVTKVLAENLIPQNDLPQDIHPHVNISVIEYLEYLVNLMTPSADETDAGSVYILTYLDDTSGKFNGPYFKINQVDAHVEHPEAYQLDIGYPGSNYVFNFDVENDENYSIFYDYQKELHPQDYVMRINANGDYEEVYAPVISSGNSQHETHADDRAWWAKVTEYPIKASVTVKGLLRPAILMAYVRLNIWVFGQKHINSGLYIITKQVDKVDGSGYQTTLNLTKIGSD